MTLTAMKQWAYVCHAPLCIVVTFRLGTITGAFVGLQTTGLRVQRTRTCTPCTSNVRIRSTELGRSLNMGFWYWPQAVLLIFNTVAVSWVLRIYLGVPACYTERKKS